MPNWLKLKGAFFGGYILVITVAAGLFLLAQCAISLSSYIGSKEYASTKQKVEVVVQKDNQVFKEEFEIRASVDKDGKFYIANLYHNGERVQ